MQQRQWGRGDKSILLTKHVCSQTEKEEQLHRLAKVLLEHETLTQADIHAVVAGTFVRDPVARPVDSEADALLGESAQPLADHSSKS